MSATKSSSGTSTNKGKHSVGTSWLLWLVAVVATSRRLIFRSISIGATKAHSFAITYPFSISDIDEVSKPLRICSKIGAFAKRAWRCRGISEASGLSLWYRKHWASVFLVYNSISIPLWHTQDWGLFDLTGYLVK